MISIHGKIILDENRYTGYDITNFIDVNDVKFKNYPFDESIEYVYITFSKTVYV